MDKYLANTAYTSKLHGKVIPKNCGCATSQQTLAESIPAKFVLQRANEAVSKMTIGSSRTSPIETQD